MTELKAGPERDRAVAEAIGYEYAGFVRRGPVYFADGKRIDESGVHRQVECGVTLFASTDLNAAFAAAEEVGLFAEPHSGSLSKHNSQWICGFYRHVYADKMPYGATSTSAPTPALAICAAILKLKEEVVAKPLNIDHMTSDWVTSGSSTQNDVWNLIQEVYRLRGDLDDEDNGTCMFPLMIWETAAVMVQYAPNQPEVRKYELRCPVCRAIKTISHATDLAGRCVAVGEHERPSDGLTR